MVDAVERHLAPEVRMVVVAAILLAERRAAALVNNMLDAKILWMWNMRSMCRVVGRFGWLFWAGTYPMEDLMGSESSQSTLIFIFLASCYPLEISR